MVVTPLDTEQRSAVDALVAAGRLDEALGRFLKAVLTTVPGQLGAMRLEMMRRARNKQRYEARVVSDAEAESAIESCRDIFAGAATMGLALLDQ